MNSTVVMIVAVVGVANYLFRWLPLRLSERRSERPQQRPWMSRVMDSIGISSICALLVISSVPDVIHDPQRLWPSLVGVAALALLYRYSHSIVIATLGGALAYGVVFKLLMG